VTLSTFHAAAAIIFSRRTIPYAVDDEVALSQKSPRSGVNEATRGRRRAQSIAVGAPAQRAPMTVTS
jgi:hypothetical protein